MLLQFKGEPHDTTSFKYKQNYRYQRSNKQIIIRRYKMYKENKSKTLSCNEPSSLRLVKTNEFITRLGISRSMFYLWMNEGLLPKSIMISDRLRVWASYEVDAVINAYIKAIPNDEKIMISKQIEQNRAGIEL